MKLIFKKSDLNEAVSIVSKAIPTRTTMSILECIFIDATTDRITFTANDMELGIETQVEGEIIERGQIAINSKIFSEIVRKLTENEVIISTDENYYMNIVSENAKFNIAGKSGDDFTRLPAVEKEKFIYLSQLTLKEIIRQTIFSISLNDESSTGKLMSGELFEINNNKLKVTSLDTHRISIRKVELKESFENVSVIVPGKTLNEVIKVLNGGNDDEVRIFFTRNSEFSGNGYSHIVFEFGSTVVVSRLIEGKYFNVSQMISSDYDVKLNVNRRELLECIDRATLMANESDKKPIIVSVTDGNVEIQIKSNLGSMDENIEATKEGKDIMIGFNPKFVMDALKAIDDEDVDIYMLNAKSPCFIKDKDENYVYIILPVNFNV